jgi:uncharacterized membrane protein (UPF0127 family)
MLLAVTACLPEAVTTQPPPPSSSSSPTTSIVTSTTRATASTTVTSGSSTTSTETEIGDLAGWELTTVELAGRPWLVAVADDPAERVQGLAGVEEMGRVEGMLFVFPTESGGAFWMKDTLIPLDIAFFAADGSLVEVQRMDPCDRDPCPLYQARSPFRWAVEAPAGDLADLDPESRLQLP